MHVTGRIWPLMVYSRFLCPPKSSGVWLSLVVRETFLTTDVRAKMIPPTYGWLPFYWLGYCQSISGNFRKASMSNTGYMFWYIFFVFWTPPSPTVLKLYYSIMLCTDHEPLCAHCYSLIKQVFPKNYINNFHSTCARTRACVKPIFCERSYWIWPKFWWKKLYGILRWCFWPQIDAPHTITLKIALSPRFSVCMLYLLTWVVHLVWWVQRSNLEWNITLQAWASIQMISNPWKSKQLVQ